MPKMYNLMHITEGVVVMDLGGFTSKKRWKIFWKTHWVSWNSELGLYWVMGLGEIRKKRIHPEYHKLFREDFELVSKEISEKDLLEYNQNRAKHKAMLEYCKKRYK